MNVVESIERKRDGHALGAEEIRGLIAGYTADAIPDYQMAALLMAILWRGLDPEELAVWTDAMLHSGDVLDFSHVAAPKVDKHSTGGVGDKVSIPLVPMVAACGVAVPMISGRGLGHTGGTLDKLESIPGFRTALDPAEFTRLLERTGLVLAGQSETLVPADRRIYALRDVTGTVPSIPLIASSIMSKKLAEGLRSGAQWATPTRSPSPSKCCAAADRPISWKSPTSSGSPCSLPAGPLPTPIPPNACCTPRSPTAAPSPSLKRS